MKMTTLSSWVTLLMAFALVILALWVWHDVHYRQPRGRHHAGLTDLLDQEERP